MVVALVASSVGFVRRPHNRHAPAIRDLIRDLLG